MIGSLEEKRYPGLIAVTSPVSNGSSMKDAIARHPALFLDVLSGERAFFARLGKDFRLAHPARQYTGPDGFHVMTIQERRDTTLRPNTMSAKQLAFPIGFGRYVTSMHPDSSYWGFNNSEDPRYEIVSGELPKSSAQSIDLFHLHTVVWGRDFYWSGTHPSRKKTDAKIREPLVGVAENYLFPQMLAHPSLQRYAGLVVPVFERDHLKFFVPGTLPLRLGHMNDLQEAQLVKDLDQAYRAAHAKLVDLFVTNREEAQQSGWQKTYSMRDEDDAIERILATPTDDVTKLKLLETLRLFKRGERRLRERGLEREPNPRLRPFEGTAYAVAGYWQNGERYLIYGPAVMRARGSNELIGIGIVRDESSQVDATKIIERNRRMAKQLARKFKPILH